MEFLAHSRYTSKCNGLGYNPVRHGSFDISLSPTVNQQTKIPAWQSSLLAALLNSNMELPRDSGSVRLPASMKNWAEFKYVRLEANSEQRQIIGKLQRRSDPVEN